MSKEAKEMAEYLNTSLIDPLNKKFDLANEKFTDVGLLFKQVLKRQEILINVLVRNKMLTEKEEEILYETR